MTRSTVLAGRVFTSVLSTTWRSEFPPPANDINRKMSHRGVSTDQRRDPLLDFTLLRHDIVIN